MTGTHPLDIFCSRTETPPRSRSRIFTCGNAQIATSPFVYRGTAVFMPEKLGNLQRASPVNLAVCHIGGGRAAARPSRMGGLQREGRNLLRPQAQVAPACPCGRNRFSARGSWCRSPQAGPPRGSSQSRSRRNRGSRRPTTSASH